MGVLACDRDGCENVMCDRFSSKYQFYLCNECFSEMCDSKLTVEMFIKTEKGGHVTALFPYEYYDNEFPVR